METPRTSASREEVSHELLAILPDMRAFARSLTRERALADDLVQDASVRALTSAHLYAPGTNFKAWVFTIMRNCFYNDVRHRQRLVQLPENVSEGSAQPGQEGALELCDFRRAFWQLSFEHREVLVLIGASGMSYDEVATICGCAVGTVKSRVSRARFELRQMFEGDNIAIARHLAPPIGSHQRVALTADMDWLTRVPAPAAQSRADKRKLSTARP